MDSKHLRTVTRWIADICDDLSTIVNDMEDLGYEDCGDTELALIHSEADKALACMRCAHTLLWSKETFGDKMARINVPIKLLDDGVEMPAYAYEGDAGLDLPCAEPTVTVQPHAHVLVSTGVAVAIPEGYAGFVMPRSGLAAKQGVTVLNTPGLIDSKYRGEIKVVLANTSDQQVSFFRGDRIAQLVIQEVPKVELIQVAALDETGRGSQGFGSSGVA